jgi:hypothetical protein
MSRHVTTKAAVAAVKQEKAAGVPPPSRVGWDQEPPKKCV